MELSFQPVMRVNHRFPHRPWHKLLCALLVAVIGYVPLALVTLRDSSKSFHPVNLPARTTPGVMHTGSFLINQRGIYFIEYTAHWSGVRNRFPAASVKWVMRQNGKVVDQGASKPWGEAGSSRDEYEAEIGTFEIGTDEPAYYDLSVYLDTNLSVLEGANPRLIVEIHPSYTKGRGLFEIIWGLLMTPIILALVFSALLQSGGDLIEAWRWKRSQVKKGD